MRAAAPAVPAAPGSPGPNAVSISDMGVRAFKGLYNTNGATSTNPGSPHSPLVDGTTVIFSDEALVLRAQALTAGDRVLMERPIRFCARA